MGVLTQKEFSQKKDTMVSQEPLIESLPDVIEKKSIVSEKTHVFMHPDSPPECNLNFKEEIIINGEELEFECVNSLVSTNNKNLINFLRDKGFYLLEVKEK